MRLDRSVASRRATPRLVALTPTVLERRPNHVLNTTHSLSLTRTYYDRSQFSQREPQAVARSSFHRSQQVYSRTTVYQETFHTRWVELPDWQAMSSPCLASLTAYLLTYLHTTYLAASSLTTLVDEGCISSHYRLIVRRWSTSLLYRHPNPNMAHTDTVRRGCLGNKTQSSISPESFRMVHVVSEPLGETPFQQHYQSTHVGN